MATSASYFLNAPSLGSATAVFTDTNLSVCAANGFYSDGVIVREQVNCVLLPQQICPACPIPPTPCGSTINASGGQGIYLLNLDTGTTVNDIGAVIVRFQPLGVPDGIRATLGANIFNKLTSSVDGFHQSTNATGITYVGQTSADCGISGTTYPTLAEFLYNGTSFVATGNTQSITVDPGDVSLGTSAPGNMLMVISKLTPSPSIINFEVVGPCGGTAWGMSVACPVLLTGFSSSVMGASSEAVCELAETVTHFNASLVNTPGIVGLNDFVFSDAFGSNQLAAGFYYAEGSIVGGNEWFEVSADGIVVAIGMCPAPPPLVNQKYFATDCGTLNPRILVIDGTPLVLGAVYRITSATTSTCFTIDSDEPTSDPVTYIESNTPSTDPIAFQLEPDGCASTNCNQV